MHVQKKSHVDKVYRADDVEHERHAQDPQLHANTLQLLTPAGMPISLDPQAEGGGRTSCHALTPAQGLERGRDGGEEKVMTVTRA